MSKNLVRRKFMAASMVLGVVPALLSGQAESPARPGVFPVGRFGAAGDGVRMDTRAVQAAVDACAKAGGGTVYFPAGRYLTGTIYLKSNVTMHLDAGAVLLGSKNLQDYPATVPAFRSYTDNYTEKSLLYGEKIENVSIEGRGAIDGQGASFEGPYKVRPYMFRLIQCRNVSFQGVTLKDSPMWGLHILACDDVDIQGIAIHSRVNRNNDGIDVDCCERVRISNCEISSEDDAIVLKSTADRPCRNITITNCVLSSYCNALKMGTESNGGFENIAISNCTIYETRLSGIALEIVDGGVMDHIIVSGITIQKVGTPIFIRLGNRARPFEAGGKQPGMGAMRNVLIRDVLATGASKIGCAVAGLPGHAIEGLVLDNIRLTFEGGGKKEDARREISEFPDKYPEHSMFGTLPAYAFYCRHVKDLSLRNIALRFDQPEERPAMVCDDVQSLDLVGSEFSSLPEGEPSILLNQVKDAFLHGNRVGTERRAFVQVSGEHSAGIRITGNDLSKARKPVEVSAGVPGGAVLIGQGQE